ncbi:hypothetical protein OS31_45600 [Dickeya oryzae]
MSNARKNKGDRGRLSSKFESEKDEEQKKMKNKKDKQTGSGGRQEEDLNQLLATRVVP